MYERGRSNNSGKGVVDIAPLMCHCSVSLVVLGGVVKGPCAFSTVLDSGLSVP